ncbi:SOUL heme-binding protein [Pedococcus cremeus]|uniref:SOUL heme-binding protein n=1 Tax=Pedococcus cremeus TaxID=587636 RepID=A0A1H9WRM8_9MICO|nr:heme-binding protein [Pedococcus cremeus]SES36474.1 SOUL heme-binding protein [Pedococcus cremeus]
MTEQLPYDVVGHLTDGVELRRYPEHAVAEVTIRGSLTGAGNLAFAPLFAYISGDNRSRSKVAMTAPVVQERARRGRGGGERVAMTAPVVQEEEEQQEALARSTDEGVGEAQERSFTVGFVLPSGLTAATAPEPADERVSLRAVPPALAAAIRYSGRWSGSAFEEHRDRLLEAVGRAGLEPVGVPRWLRYDPPFKPWFLRRNEVVVDVSEP